MVRRIGRRSRASHAPGEAPTPCRPPRGRPDRSGGAARLPWRVRLPTGSAQSRQPSHPREHIHGLVADDPFRRQPDPSRRPPRGARHPSGGGRRCDGHDAPGAGPDARGLPEPRGLQRDPERDPPGHRPLGPRGVLRGRRRLRRDQHLRREPRGAGASTTSPSGSSSCPSPARGSPARSPTSSPRATGSSAGCSARWAPAPSCRRWATRLRDAARRATSRTPRA